MSSEERAARNEEQIKEETMKVIRFEDLKVWQKAHQLVLGIYKVTREYPPDEKFGLISQMRRAAVSVPANIAEGFRKRGKKDKTNFYNIAQGSLDELCYYMILSKDLEYVPAPLSTLYSLLTGQLEETARMLAGLIIAVMRDER
jgi:four helix bundle protein